MNRWRKLLVLWLLCVTMPLQAMAALRTHCAPGTTTDASATMAMHHAMTMSAQGNAMPGMHHHDSAAADNASASPTAHQDASSAPAAQANPHTLHASCSACAACVVCTALPPSVAIRTPDAQPSAAIPFLRTSAASAVVAVPERPPKALVA
ncbi:hypothetical protein [Pandoraea fibrosis]|uniref:Copper resistance protein B n=1 Tax=Pandoraea fibrosis TaxID=1891094 RepID=A0A5E4U672_9BURK|nr:hypothetical protein [Pandoraea fibrosis]VVD95311.1 hypothetical protein PFI31113_01806 [Pandoraea fibrosis]